MAPTGVNNQLSARRAALAGPTGMKGLFNNGIASSIALFAALGGLVYGCMFLSTRLIILVADVVRQSRNVQSDFDDAFVQGKGLAYRPRYGCKSS